MQSHNPNKEIEVLIVGAGPSGLMMACQLALQGIRFRIIDKKKDPTSYSGALIIQSRSLEIFNQMGIAQQLISEGIVASNINIIFNGQHLVKIPVKNIGEGLTHFPYLLMVKQSKTEQLLTQFLNERGFSIERCSELIKIQHDLAGAISLIKHHNGATESILSKFIIAADGGQSIVRQQLNILFKGKTHQKSLFITDCMANTEMKADEISFSFSDKTISGFFPLMDGKWRVDGTISKKLESKGNLTFRDMEKQFSERIKMDTKLHSPDWFSVFHSNQRYATSFQHKNCFLIGDAAHVHSPVGAQGMNTGLQDAFNLAWKLAFVLKGKAKCNLLESYTPERLPIAKNIISATDNIFNLVTSDHIVTKTVRLLIIPFLIKSLLPFFVNSTGFRQNIFKSIAQINIHYRESTLSRQASIGLFPIKSPRPGDRLPYIRFREKNQDVNIQDKINGSVFHLFIFANDTASPELINLSGKYKKILSVEIIQYTPESSHLFKSMGIRKNGYVLVRPDLYIAFHSDNHKTTQLENYLQHYFELS